MRKMKIRVLISVFGVIGLNCSNCLYMSFDLWHPYSAIL